MVLASLLNSCDGYDACTIFHELRGGGPSCIAHGKLGSIVQSICKIVQMNLSLFITNWKSDVSTSSSDHFSILGDCHSAYHFPMSTSDGSCFSHSDIHCLASFSSDFSQASEALQPSLMVMTSPHYLGMTTKND